jgi:hypothetical protein
VTIAGIPKQDALSIITAALIHHHDTYGEARDKLRQVKVSKDADSVELYNAHIGFAWCKRIMNILNMVEARLQTPFERGNSKAERWRRVRESIKDRRIINELMLELTKEAP